MSIYKIFKEVSSPKKLRLSDEESSYKYIKSLIGSDLEVREHFYLIALDNSLNVIDHYLVSVGGITGTVFDIRLCMHFLINRLAIQVQAVHNHPSGTLRSSKNDRMIHRKLTDACKLFDIHVLPSMIITSEGFTTYESD